MAIKRGQIRKADIPKFIAAFDNFDRETVDRRARLKPEFQQWLIRELGELRQRVNDQDYVFAVNSTSRHIATSFLRMESGEIKAITETGGFQL